MKQVIIYMLSLLVLAAGLTACGMTEKPGTTALPSATPYTNLPDVDNGIITDNESADDGLDVQRDSGSADFLPDNGMEEKAPHQVTPVPGTNAGTSGRTTPVPGTTAKP